MLSGDGATLLGGDLVPVGGRFLVGSAFVGERNGTSNVLAGQKAEPNLATTRHHLGQKAFANLRHFSEDGLRQHSMRLSIKHVATPRAGA